MGRSLFIALALSGVLAAPTASPDRPDGTLVLAVAGHSPGSRVVSREWAGVADPRSGAIRKRLLPGGTLCHGPVLAVGGRVVYSGFDGRRAVARALPLSLRGPARSLGAAQTFAPSPSGDRLVLDPDLPRWTTLHAATTAGLVVTRGRWLMLWDARADRVLRRVRDGWFVAAARSRVAWCRGRCRALRVWNTRGERTLAPPAGMRLLSSSGAFSPDGRRLAVGVTVDGRSRLALADARSGRWTLVPDGELGVYHAVAWSPSGRWLYFTDGNEGLRAWRPGAPSATTLPIDAGGTVMSIAAAG
jgi:hypothetical protein